MDWTIVINYGRYQLEGDQMSMKENLENLKNAYAVWHTEKGSNTQVWHDLVSDNVRFQSVTEEAPGLSFAADGASRADLVRYFDGLLDQWTMNYWTPEHFVMEGNQIAMFGRCGYTFRATGKDIETMVAHLWKFEGSKIVEFVEIFDSARVAAGTVN